MATTQAGSLSRPGRQAGEAEARDGGEADNLWGYSTAPEVSPMQRMSLTFRI